MIEDVVVEPMTKEFILWRCLHDGPLSRDNINQWPSASTLPWVRYRYRNTPLLTKLTRTYGVCAIIARDADQIVGQLRSTPRPFAAWRALVAFAFSKIIPQVLLKILPIAIFQTRHT